MSPLQFHWKSWLAPAGVTLVAVWGLYLGISCVIVSADGADSDGEQRASQRDERFSHLSNHSELANISAEHGSAVSLSEKAVSVSGSNESPSPRVKAYQSARRAVALADVVLSNSKTGARSFQQRPRLSISRANTQNMLREQIMGEAYQIAMQSKNPWQNLISISSEYYRRGDRSAARDILLTAEKLAVDPDDAAQTSIAVRNVVKAMLAQRNNDDAMRALQNISRGVERESAMADVAVWAARDGRLDIARNLVDQISSARNRDAALVAIAESQASYEGLSTAAKTAETIFSMKKKNDAYRRIALKRAAVKDFSEAELAVVYIRDEKLRDSALGSVARQRARSGDMAGGLKTMRSVNDPSIADASLRSLSEELAGLGRFSSSAYVTTRIGDNREKSFALERLSVELAKSGDIMGSLVRSDAIPLNKVRERTLRNVSSVTAGRGAPKRARNVAFRIQSTRERGLAYRNIAKAAAKNGDHVTAFNTLQEIELPRDKALAMVSLARARQKDGSNRKALSLLVGAGRTASQVGSVRDLDTIRANMAVAYAERSEAERSLHLVAKITDSKRRDQAYRNLAGTLAVNRDIHSAQMSVMSISSQPLRRTAEENVARTMARYVSPQKAVRSARSLLSGRQRVVFLLAVSRKT